MDDFARCTSLSAVVLVFHQCSQNQGDCNFRTVSSGFGCISNRPTYCLFDDVGTLEARLCNISLFTSNLWACQSLVCIRETPTTNLFSPISSLIPRASKTIYKFECKRAPAIVDSTCYSIRASKPDVTDKKASASHHTQACISMISVQLHDLSIPS